MNTDTYSVHDKLHALADGQLDTQQSREVLSLLAKDHELQREMCEIQRIKYLVQSAYPLPSSHLTRVRKAGGLHMGQAAVYLLAFLLTFVAGFGSYPLLEKSGAPVEGLALQGVPLKDDHFIVFIDSNEPGKLEKALVKAENLARQVQVGNGSVDVVTSAEGIDLLRLGTTPYEKRITELSESYPELHFVACNSTLYLFKQRGELVALVDEAEVASSAVEYVVKHLQQGWRYVAI